MEELRIPITEADILKPTPAQVQRIYELFVELYMGPQALQLCQTSTQPSFSTVEILEYPGIYMDAIQLTTFYRTVATLMESVGIDDFSLKDVIKPETPRLRMIFSGLINFAKFREEQLSLFESHSSKQEASLSQRKKLETQYQAALDRLGSLQSQRAKESALIQELEKTLSAMTSTIKDLKRDQAVVSDEVTQLKTAKEQLTDQLASCQFTLVSLKQDCAKIQGRIVQNPEALIQSLADLTEDTKRERASSSVLDQNARSIQRNLDKISALDQDLSRCISTMEDSHQLVQAISELEANIQAMKEDLEKQSTASQDAQARYQQLERQQSAVLEKLDRLKQQQQAKRNMVNESLGSLREEYETMCRERQSVQEKVDQNDIKIKETEMRMLELKRDHEQEQSQLASAYQSLEAQMRVYCGEMKRALDVL